MLHKKNFSTVIILDDASRQDKQKEGFMYAILGSTDYSYYNIVLVWSLSKNTTWYN